MKKIVSVLLALALVLALTGSAMAGCKFKEGDFVKFVKNSNCYNDRKASSKWDDPETIIRKGSNALVIDRVGSWVAVQITAAHKESEYGKIGNAYVEEGGERYYFWACWVKEDVLKASKKNVVDVTFANGGVGGSKPLKDKTFDDKGGCVDRTDIFTILESVNAGKTRLSPDCDKHVKAKAKTWMHKTPSLSNSYGQALHKGDKVTYRRKWALDTRGTIFYGIKYKGKCLWVSEKYTKIVK